MKCGLSVTGLDLSLPLLLRAADESQKRALSVNFVHSDMRGMAFDQEFDGAYCMLSSFGYFDEESNLKVAEVYVEAFGNLAKAGNTLIVPSNLSDMATLVASAMTIVSGARHAELPPPAAAK